MNVIVCCKFTPDVQDMESRPDGTVGFDKAQWQISEYDLQAVEAGAQLAAATGGKLVALSLGTTRLNTVRLQKDLLSRGPEELYLVIDDSLSNADAAQTASLLAAAIRRIGADVVLFGEGSADCYNQQVGLQVGARLGWATVNGVDAVESIDGALRVDQLLETQVQVLELPFPAAITVTSSINNPPVPGMRAVLAAGKKPVTVWALSDLEADAAPRMSIDATVAAKTANRKGVIFEGSLEEVAEQLVKSLEGEGVL